MSKSTGMRGLSPIRVALGTIDRTTRPLIAASAFVHIVERLALIAVALAFSGAASMGRVDVLVVFFVLYVARGALRSVLTGRVHVRLHDAAFEALLTGDLLCSSVLEDADAEAALLNGLDRGARLVGDLLPQLVGDAVVATLVATYLLLHEPAGILAVIAATLLVAGLAVVVARRWTLTAMEAAWEQYQPVLDGLVAAALARLEIVANGGASTFLSARRTDVLGWVKKSTRADQINSLAGRAPVVFGGVLLVAAVIADRSLRSGELSAAAMGHAAVFASMLPAFAGLAWGAHEATKASTLFAPMAEILTQGGAPPGRAGRAVTLPAPITFDGITFAYPGARLEAVRDVSFVWRPGTALVLRGQNGSGKSTLMKLLLGVGANGTQGAMRVGDVPVSELDLAAWHRRIAYLPQRPYLVERAKVGRALSALDDRPSDDARAKDALARVGLLDALERKSPGAPLDVVVGALSAGERQRLALARALASGKELVLLDEPDANLDAEGIERVVALVRELKSTCMVAVCAHTPELIAAGDLVIHLENGALVTEKEAQISAVR